MKTDTVAGVGDDVENGWGWDEYWTCFAADLLELTLNIFKWARCWPTTEAGTYFVRTSDGLKWVPTFLSSNLPCYVVKRFPFHVLTWFLQLAMQTQHLVDKSNRQPAEAYGQQLTQERWCSRSPRTARAQLNWPGPLYFCTCWKFSRPLTLRPKLLKVLVFLTWRCWRSDLPVFLETLTNQKGSLPNTFVHTLPPTISFPLRSVMF